MGVILAPLEKVLEKSIIPDKDREVFPGEAEFRGKREEQIIRHASTASTDVTLFVVPIGFTLWITSAWCGGFIEHGLANTSGNAGIRIRQGGAGVGDFILGLIIADQTTSIINLEHFTSALDYPMPIRVNEGGDVILDDLGSTVGRILGGFQGWIEKKEITPFRVIPQ